MRLLAHPISGAVFASWPTSSRFRRLGRHSSSRTRTVEERLLGLLQGRDGLLPGDGRKIVEELRKSVAGRTSSSSDSSRVRSESNERLPCVHHLGDSTPQALTNPLAGLPACERNGASGGARAQWSERKRGAGGKSARSADPLAPNLEAPPGFEPGMEVLQTSALPLGDGAAIGCVSCGWYEPASYQTPMGGSRIPPSRLRRFRGTGPPSRLRRFRATSPRSSRPSPRPPQVRPRLRSCYDRGSRRAGITQW